MEYMKIPHMYCKLVCHKFFCYFIAPVKSTVEKLREKAQLWFDFVHYQNIIHCLADFGR